MDAYIDFNLKCPKVFEFFRRNEAFEFKRRVQDAISPKRFEHCLAVGGILFELDRSVGANTSLILGLAHDYTKELSDYETIDMIWKNRLPLYEGERENKQTLHAVTAGFLFGKVFPSAPLVYSFAIRHHTILSSQYLNDLCFNLFVADKIDYTRSYIPNQFRKEIIAMDDAARRAYSVLKMQKKHFGETGGGFFKRTSELYEMLEQKYEKR